MKQTNKQTNKQTKKKLPILILIKVKKRSEKNSSAEDQQQPTNQYACAVNMSIICDSDTVDVCVH